MNPCPPTNDPSSDGPEHQPALPELQTALLDRELVLRLFNDIACLGTSHEIILKTGPGYVTLQDPVTLEHARERLLEGSVLGVQIRYHHGGAEWWDTLLHAGDGVRLVRIRQEFS